MKLVLHSYWRSSASHRVRIGLGLKQLPYDYVAVNILQGEQQSDAYRAASPNYAGTGHVSWMPRHPPEHAERGAESFADIVARVHRVQERLEARLFDERVLCVSHWGFLHFFLGATIFREDFAPHHLPALYRISHINTGITLFHHRRDYLIEGIRFDGWALQTWNDQAHL